MSLQSVMSSVLAYELIERSKRGRYKSLVVQIGVGV